MARLESYSREELRRMLDRAQGRESVQQLMLAIAYESGQSVAELSDQYGIPVDRVDDWFERLETRPHDEALAGLERLSVSTRAATPVGSASEPATVEYLAYDAVRDQGWDLADDDLFERAARADLDDGAYGGFRVDPDQSILDAAADAGVDLPYACRGGACSNCAVSVHGGEVAMSGDHVLPPTLIREEDVRLACVGTPTTGHVQLVFGVDHLDALEDLKLPAEGFGIETAD
jgi:ferredoxin